jgi:hypothetical protein
MRIRSWISWVQGLWAFCCQVNFSKYWTCAKKIANGTPERLSKNPIRRRKKKKGKTKEYAYQACKRKPRNKRFAGFLIKSNFLQSSGPRLPTVRLSRCSSVPSLCTSKRETQRECTPCHQDFRNKRSSVIISPPPKKKKEEKRSSWAVTAAAEVTPERREEGEEGPPSPPPPLLDLRGLLFALAMSRDYQNPTNTKPDS